MEYYHNGRILTQCDHAPAAHNILFQNGKVLAINAAPPVQAKIFDLKGDTLAPGFVDAHIHIWKVGDLLTYMLDLRGVTSREQMLGLISDFGQKFPQRPWILARGFNEALFEDGQLPTRHDLDRVLANRPCMVIRTCAHIAVLNSAALHLCSISGHSVPPAGGEIRLGADGQPTGILTETALGLVQRHIPPPSPEAYREMILAAQAALIGKGIVSATDPAVMPDLLEVYRSMDRAGELKVHVNAVPIRLPDGAVTPLPLPELYEGRALTVNTVKFFADGGISGKTAAVKLPYKGSRDEHGMLRLDRAQFLQLAQEAQDAGFKIATHAIGDAAIDRVLEVYALLQHSNGKGLRHRIEHLGLPEPEHLAQMRDMGVFCVSQPTFLYELGRNFRQYLPDTYLNRIYPYRAVLDAGVPLAFSSDAPVVRDFDPISGIRHALLREDASGKPIAPDQSLSFEEAVKAYTATAAQANGDSRRGIFEEGCEPGFVVLKH